MSGGDTSIIIGIDPGKVTGWCVVGVTDGRLDGANRGDLNGDRADLWRWLFPQYPGSSYHLHIAVEQPFLMRGIDTLDAVTKYGVCQLFAEVHKLPFHSYHVSTIRRLVTGSGRSKDAEVTAAVRDVLGISRNPGPGKGLGAHQPAALAAALCCAVEVFGVRLEREAT